MDTYSVCIRGYDDKKNQIRKVAASGISWQDVLDMEIEETQGQMACLTESIDRDDLDWRDQLKFIQTDVKQILVSVSKELNFKI